VHPVIVERSPDAVRWLPGGSLQADGSGYVEFVDHDVVAGRRYGYRLVVDAPTGALILGRRGS